jgi:molybdopterin molybdotransferase
MSALPDYAEALAGALRSAAPIREQESVALAASPGRILAEPIVADRDLPPFNRAQMDGYALRAAEFSPERAWPVAGTVPAGDAGRVRVPPGYCVAVATGAPLPDDVDTIIQHEHSDRGDREGMPVRFSVPNVTRGLAVHPRGADARAGQVLTPRGTRLQAHHLGIAAMVGCRHLIVVRRPRAVVLTSGDEVRPVDSPVESHQIRNSNAPMLAELLGRFGSMMLRHEHLPDVREPTMSAVGRALHDSDLVITVGGVSAGDRDHFPAAFEACCVEPSLRSASIQPGRPIWVGRATGAGGAIVVGLPGNPVSALACACLFIWPIVQALLGLPADLPWRGVELAAAVRPNAARRAFRPAIVQPDGRIIVPSWAGSGDLAHTGPTHGLAELPVQRDEVPAGARVRFLPWP